MHRLRSVSRDCPGQFQTPRGWRLLLCLQAADDAGGRSSLPGSVGGLPGRSDRQRRRRLSGIELELYTACPNQRSTMANLIKIAQVTDVAPDQARAFTVEGQRIALFNVEGTYYAIADTCTHDGGPLSEGQVQGSTVTCPWHGAEFDLKSGAVLGPPA